MTVFEPVDASSTYESTVQRLGTAIRIGVLAPGSRLPPERDLAEQLGISRSTLRQALATLTGSGHLTAVRGRLGGTFVSDDPPLSSGAPFPLAEWRALLDCRLAIELGAVQLAAERASDEDLDRLVRAHALLEDRLDADFIAYRRADVDFHVTLAEISGSLRLVAQMLCVHGRLSDLYAALGLPESPRDEACAGHRSVLEAVLARDAAGAVLEMRRHLETTERLVADALAEPACP